MLESLILIRSFVIQVLFLNLVWRWPTQSMIVSESYSLRVSVCDPLNNGECVMNIVVNKLCDS